ncbi:MAG: NAD(P)/FAD-dependent oxidoreductase [Desulfurococcales archaeon]|nr:NAD(P)/FAD-dependent oxidoreductase [Desulfurococcales archaeon]
MDTDIVIVGAGVNGLAAAKVLAGEGLRVLVIDANPFPGGLAGGFPGIADSMFAYAIGLVPGEVDKFLGIGLSSLLHEPDPSWVDMGGDGEILFRWWRSRSRLHEEARERGLPGLEGLLRLVDSFWACYKRAGLYYTWEPPSPDRAAAALGECGDNAARLLEESSSRVLREYLPVHAWSLVLYPSMYNSNGFALAYYLQNSNVWSLPLAGTRLVSHRLYELARSAGAEFLLGEMVVGLEVSNSGVAGVRTAGGRRISARATLYAGPIFSLPRLEGAGRLLEEWEIRALRLMSRRRLDVVRVDYYVRRRPSPPREEGWRGWPIIVYWTERGGGEYTYPSLYAGNPLLVQGSGGIRDPFNPLPPGVEEEDIIVAYVRGRREQERCCFNSTGHPDHVPMVDPYLMDKRPLPGWASYKTSAPGLYHGSASSYPGGEVNLVAGLNAAMRILVDLGYRDRAERIRRSLESLAFSGKKPSGGGLLS